jgi:hypothetical protein
MTIGLDEPFIVVTTGLVELMDYESMRFTIGHEMGHALSGHALYRTMLIRMLQLMDGMSWMPVGYWGLRAIVFALREWFRKAELSADRAGLLCSQDPAAALRAHVLLAGATDLSEVDTAEFLKQAKEYQENGDIRDSVLKLMNTWDKTHPLAVIRAAELQRWAATEEYRDILAGNYPRRTEEPHNTMVDDLKSAAKSYKDNFANSSDPLAKVMHDVGDVFSDVTGKIFQAFRKDGGASTAGESGESAETSEAQS